MNENEVPVGWTRCRVLFAEVALVTADIAAGAGLLVTCDGRIPRKAQSVTRFACFQPA
jgi:predicted metal-dependent hydrolase